MASFWGLGTGFLGCLFSYMPEAKAAETVHFALDRGINFFDTSPSYGLSEERLGRALVGVPRDQYILCTKVGDRYTAENEHSYDFSREGVQRSLENSLRRLKTDHLDIILLHDPDHHERPWEALDEAYPVLTDWRRQGIVKAIGVGVNYWETLVYFAREAEFDCFLLAGRYTLLEQRSLAALSMFQSKGISVILGGVLNTGILATGAIPGALYTYGPASEPILERVRRIEKVCARYAVPLHAVALKFPAAHTAVTAYVVGVQSTQEIESDIQAWQTPVPPALWEDLREEGLIDRNAPVPGDSSGTNDRTAAIHGKGD
jgi:D-threo-aldose 1-dehydrogenase